MSIVDTISDLIRNPKNTVWLAPILLLADAVLSGIIVLKVPYTEIDWRAYIAQVQQYIDGERVYTKIRGGTGPLVYPGLHVYIYRLLYTLTEQGTNIQVAQIIFVFLYLANLVLVLACYRQAKAPPYILIPLVLSKRLHSIFMLRCFNDCFAVMALWLTIYAYQRRMWTLGSFFFTCGLGVKMNLLLVLPSVGLILLQAMGRERAITQAILMTQMQLLFGLEFLKKDPIAYISRAFNFSRQFEYRWTVNWRFLSETTFLSKSFSYTLLSIHACLLTLFAITRWMKPSQRGLGEFLRTIIKEPSDQDQVSRRVNSQFIMTTILAANAIGMLCARSLHYQFYSWTAWATPYLLWRGGFHPVMLYLIWGIQELAWNVYPSSYMSSIAVIGTLMITVMGVWWGTRNDYTKQH